MWTDDLERHAQEAAALWTLRDASALAPHHDAASLAALDERVDAHIDALRAEGERGVEAAAAALDAGSPGSVFAAAVLAIGRDEGAGLGPALAMAEASPRLCRALTAALAWVPFLAARPVVERLLRASASPALRRVGIAASAAHRRDPGEPLAWAALEDDARLSARAFRAVGELARVDLLPVLREHLASGDEERRFWAAWSSVLLGEGAALEPLWAIAASGGRFAERACSLSVRGLAVGEARARVESLGAAEPAARAAIAGAEALGDPASVPWLFSRMESPALARAAGEAVATITGVAIERDLATAPASHGAGAAADPDHGLPWPAVGPLRAWWASKEKGFRPGERHLLGAPLTPESAQAVLRDGSQKRRASAALEMALLRPGRPLFEVRVHERAIT
jgi:uncharacterized protein (TIGR02270 family)